MSAPIRIRIVEPGFEGYTGLIHRFNFTDGVSDELLHRVDIDRLSTALRFETVVEEDAPEGVAPQPVGIAHRLTWDRDRQAEVIEPSQVQTEEEKLTEEMVALEKAMAETAPPKRYTDEELQRIADEKGMAGIRAIAEPLGLKDRRLVDLMAQIAEKQDEIITRWTLKHEAKVAALAELQAQKEALAGPAEEPAEFEFEEVTPEELAADGIEANEVPVRAPVDDVLPTLVEPPAVDLLDAAASGDLGAALDASETDRSEDA